MKLPDMERFSPATIREWARVLGEADAQNLKRNRDLFLTSARVVLVSPNGSRWALTVDDTGNVTGELYETL